MQNMSVESLAHQQYDAQLALINHYLEADNKARETLLARNPGLDSLLKKRYTLPLTIIFKIYTYLDIQTQRNLYTSVCKTLNEYMKRVRPFEPIRFQDIAAQKEEMLKTIGKLTQLEQQYGKGGKKTYRGYFRPAVILPPLTLCVSLLAYTSYLIAKLFKGNFNKEELDNCIEDLANYMRVTGCEASKINLENACPNSNLYISPVNTTALCELQSNETCIQSCEFELSLLLCDTIECPGSKSFLMSAILLFVLSFASTVLCLVFLPMKLLNNEHRRLDNYRTGVENLGINVNNNPAIQEIDAELNNKLLTLTTDLNTNLKGDPELGLRTYHKKKLNEKTKGLSMAGNLARSMPMLSSSESDDAPSTAPTETTPLLINSSYYGAGS